MAKRKVKFTPAFGCVRDDRDDRDHLYKAPRPLLKALPPFTTNRANAPSTLEQKSLGACVFHSGANAFRFAQKKVGKSPKPIMPSRLYWYYETRRNFGHVRRDEGAQIRNAMKVLADEGVCDEKMWVYNPDNFRVQPPRACYGEALGHQAIEYLRVPQEISQLKARLAEGFPIMVGIKVYDSFMGMEVATTGKADMPKKGETKGAGHAVLLWDFNDNGQRWVLQNSWGDSWGKKGFFSLPYNYLLDPKLGGDYWTLRQVE